MKWYKELWFELMHPDPDSPASLRHRAEILIEEGYSKDNPYVTMLLKKAEILEGGDKK